MGKLKVCLYCYLTADILTKVLQKCSLSSPLPNIWILFKPLYLIGSHGKARLNLRNNIKKIISSEVIRGIKLKFCRNVHNISLFKNIVLFVAVIHVLSSIRQQSFHRLIMGKVKVGLNFDLSADILTKVLQKCSLNSPLPNIWILSKPLNLIGCNGNGKAEFVNIFKKSSPQKP